MAVDGKDVKDVLQCARDDDTDGKSKVVCRSMELAYKYYKSKKYGRALAHFLVILKLEPESKHVLSDDVTVSLSHWSDELCGRGLTREMFDLYEQVLTVLPHCSRIHTQLALHLYRLGHPHNALSRLRLSLQLDPTDVVAKQNKENLVNLIERWHFRMLNDSSRNRAFSSALRHMIQKKGHRSVLDIGAGSGLLSMLCVRFGSRYTYLCESNPSMYDICRLALIRNNMYERVRMYDKHSTQLTTPQHIPHR